MQSWMIDQEHHGTNQINIKITKYNNPKNKFATKLQQTSGGICTLQHELKTWINL